MGTYPAFNPPNLPQKNWFQRHVGCTVAGGCGVLLAVVLLFVCTTAIFVFGVLKNSDATKLALERARANPIVLEHIGQPVELGFIISGNINVNGSSGHADLEIPIHGNKGKGTIYVVADKRAGLWTFSTLDVAFADGSPRIDLLQRPIE